MKHTTNINWNHEANKVYEILGFKNENELDQVIESMDEDGELEDIMFATLLLLELSMGDTFLIRELLGLECGKKSEVIEQIVKSIDDDKKRRAIATHYMSETSKCEN